MGQDGISAGQVALVTGASSGLGRGFAKSLAAAGAKVAVAARRRDRLESLVAEIEADGGQAFPVTLDVADASSFDTVLDEIEGELGLVTLLVNNAGITDGQRATKLPLETIDQVLAVNVRAPYVLSRDVAKRLIAAERPGRIINIASISAYNHSAATAAATLYSVSKAAVVRITEVLAMEWARFNINVNAIAPGLFESEMSAGFFERVGDGVLDRLPRKRIGRAENIEGTLLYLAGPSSEMVTGTCIILDDAQGSR